MQKWIDNFKTVEDERIELAIVSANNHYAGFGPGTVNIFRNMIGLPEAKWYEREEGEEQQYPAHDLKQRTISDFLGSSSLSYPLLLLPISVLEPNELFLLEGLSYLMPQRTEFV
jgi:hypothetical protein